MKCPTCGKTFAVKMALDQHIADKHRKPAAKSKPSKAKKPKARSGVNEVTESGVDLLGQIRIGSRVTIGQKLAEFPLTCSQMGQRIQQLAGLWDRWRPISLVVELVGAGAMMVNGSYAVGFSMDPAFQLLNSSTDAARVVALRPSVSLRVQESHRINVPCDSSRKWYMLRSSVDDSTHGKLVAVVLSDFGGFTGTLGVTVLLHWRVSFQGVNLSVAQALDDVIRADAGWPGPFFTTSDASFNSEVLTLKEHSGGDMVPFSSAKPGTLLKPATGTTIRYYDSSKSEKTIPYATVLPSSTYAIPGLVFFSTKEDAVAFIRSGDVAKCLKYTSPGNFCSPDSVTFKVDKLSTDDPFDEVVKVLENLSRRVEQLSIENDSLRSTAAAQSVGGDVEVLVTDQHVLRRVRDVIRDLNQRPRGTAGDPLKTVVLDPVVPGYSGASEVSLCSCDDDSQFCPIHGDQD